MRDSAIENAIIAKNANKNSKRQEKHEEDVKKRGLYVDTWAIVDDGTGPSRIFHLARDSL